MSLVSLELALERAHKAEGAPVKRPVAQQTNISKTADKVRWQSQNFGSVEIEIQSFKFGELRQDKNNAWAPIYEEDKEPKYLSFFFDHRLQPGVRLLHAMGGTVSDVTEGKIPFFRIETEWDRKSQCHIPHTREKDKDNFDLVFLAEDGSFIQLQVSVVTRCGKFWLAIQQIFAGQVATTTPAKAQEIGLTSIQNGKTAMVIPLTGDFMYPGCDYLNTFKTMGPKVVEHALSRGATTQLSKCAIPQWEPQWPIISEEMKNNEWRGAIVNFFNLVIGWGFVTCEDGKACFVHFKQMIDVTGRPIASKGEFPHLNPRQKVAVKWEEDNTGKRKATALRVL